LKKHYLGYFGAFLTGVMVTLLICCYAARDRDESISALLKTTAFGLYEQNVAKGNYQEAAYYIRKAKETWNDQNRIYEAGLGWGILYPVQYANPYAVYVRIRYGFDEATNTRIHLGEQEFFVQVEKSLNGLMKDQSKDSTVGR
jgi:hypothetical protein